MSSTVPVPRVYLPDAKAKVLQEHMPLRSRTSLLWQIGPKGSRVIECHRAVAGVHAGACTVLENTTLKGVRVFTVV